MRAPVHYDVDAAVDNFLAKSDAIYGDARPVGERAHVQLRHRAIAAGFLRLALEEANRGTDHQHALEGAADIIVEFLVNYVQSFDEGDRFAVSNYFLFTLATGLQAALKCDTSQFPSAETPKTYGGHA